MALGSGWLNTDEGHQQLIDAEWSIAYLRLMLAVALTGVILGLIDFKHPGYDRDLTMALVVLGLAHSFLQVLGLYLWKSGVVARALIATSFDLLLITGAVYATGGVLSEFYLVYYLIMVAVAMRFGLGPVLVASALSSLMYLGAVIVHSQHQVASHGDSVVIRIVVMVTTAALAGGFHRELANRLRALVQTRKMRDDFLMVASHELKTPLVAIRGISQVLDRLMKDGSTERALLQRVDASIDRMQRLIRDLTDAARIDAGTLTMEPATVDLVSIARAAIDEIRLGNPRREVKFRSSEEHLRVEGDSQRLSQVFTNLLTNAVKFTTPDRGAIVLEVRRDSQGRGAVTVRDRGLGIPRESLPVIFEKHGRSSRTPAMGFAGLGLGLYITRAIVLAHGGSIDVESTEGEGSAFTIRLPLAPERVVGRVDVGAPIDQAE